MKTTFSFFDGNKTLWSGAAMAAVLMIAGGAPATSHALVLTAADATCTSDANGGNDTVFLSGCGVTGLTELFKMDRGATADTGTFANFYTATFVPATEATITWNGPDYIQCPTCYLVAKDGNSAPNWFLFNLATWDGKQTIEIDPLFYFTNTQGNRTVQNFSHLSIWGTDVPGNGGTPPLRIPEPGMLLLVGAGLVGLGLARRRKSA